MPCEYCIDQDGESCFPVYGLGPHTHNKGVTHMTQKNAWPENYSEDPEFPGFGIWWCPHCGDGKPADSQANAKVQPSSEVASAATRC